MGRRRIRRSRIGRGRLDHQALEMGVEFAGTVKFRTIWTTEEIVVPTLRKGLEAAHSYVEKRVKEHDWLHSQGVHLRPAGADV